MAWVFALVVLAVLVAASVVGAVVLYPYAVGTPGFGTAVFAFLGVGVGTVVGALAALATGGRVAPGVVYAAAVLGVLIAGLMGGVGFYVDLGVASAVLTSGAISLVFSSPTFAVVYVAFAIMKSVESLVSIVRAALSAKGG